MKPYHFISGLTKTELMHLQRKKERFVSVTTIIVPVVRTSNDVETMLVSGISPPSLYPVVFSYL